jgi:cytochrome b subunit of formate dehydrogenase
MATGDLLVYVGMAIFAGAFLAVVFIQFRLKHHVSKEKVHALEDVSQLWKNVVPPKRVLNDKGLRLYRYGWALMVMFLIAAGMLLFALFSAPPGPHWLLPTFVIGTFVAGACFEPLLKRYVSKEKVRAVEDVSQLWKYLLPQGSPPKIVLNEQGLRLHRRIRVLFGIFLTGVGIMLFGAIFL